MPTSFALLGYTALTSTASSVSFDNLNQTYRDLKIYVAARSSDSLVTYRKFNLGLRFNDVTTTTYNQHHGYFYGGGGSGTANDANFDYLFVACLPNKEMDSSSNFYGGARIHIGGYSASGYEKPGYAQSIAAGPDTISSKQFFISHALLWKNTSPITKITFFPIEGSTHFSSGSTIHIYGMKTT